jgi:hypothetical protein
MLAIPRYNLYAPITKSDTVDFPLVAQRTLCDAIWVGGAGIVVAIQEDGTAVNFTAVAGSIIPIAAKRVNSATTTATLLVALYWE